MSSENPGADVAFISIAFIVFGLPLALLIPNFSIWNIVPKIHVHRFHILSNYLTWFQLNFATITFAVLFLCLYLEIRKRIFDEMVEEVLAIKEATITTFETENERQAVTMKACVELLDASSDNYENLMLLQDELCQRDRVRQRPPTVQLSACEM